MRHVVLILSATVLSGALPAQAQITGMSGSGQPFAYDPMTVPPGMQAVPVMPHSIPAGAQTQAIQAYASPTQALQMQGVPCDMAPPAARSVPQPASRMAEMTVAENAPRPAAAPVTVQALPVSQFVPAPDMAAAVAPAQAQALSAPEMPAGLQEILLQQQAMQAQPQPQFQTQPQTQTQTQFQTCAHDMTLQLSHGITYMTGGTTQQEIERFKAMDGEFNLQLLFADAGGGHLVNHQLRILDYTNFELVKAVAVGPYLYARINPGDYSLEVVHEPGMEPVSVKIRVPAQERLRRTVLLK